MSDKGTGAASFAGAVAVAWTLALLRRRVRRGRSPAIESKLACPCGKVKGTVRAIAEDSTRIRCYCNDCRDYARAVMEQGTRCTKTAAAFPSSVQILQVCKSAVTITEGRECMRLARKSPEDGGMHRFYCGSCHTPLMNTFDFLGFVGVLEDNLDGEREKFYGPVQIFEELAAGPIERPVPKVNMLRFLWGLVRYAPWTKAGPFDCGMTPFYWKPAIKDK